MKAIQTLCFLILFVPSLAFSQTVSPKASDFSKLNWLEGTWTRTNITKPGRTAHERWEKSGEQELRGYGVTMQGQDTVFLEKITVLIKDNAIYYIADVPQNQLPVYFKLTEITESGFVCENPDHDFPKQISYQLEGDKLEAQISGNGKAIDYWFERKTK
jgi:hypothetical protein